MEKLVRKSSPLWRKVFAVHHYEENTSSQQNLRVSAKSDHFWILQAALNFYPRLLLIKLVPGPMKWKFSDTSKVFGLAAVLLMAVPNFSILEVERLFAATLLGVFFTTRDLDMELFGVRNVDCFLENWNTCLEPLVLEEGKSEHPFVLFGLPL